MEKLGVYLCGLFTEISEFVVKETGEVRYRVTVATGRYSYGVYMADNQDITLLRDTPMGTMITLKARPYAGKNGLSWSDGELVEL